VSLRSSANDISGFAQFKHRSDILNNCQAASLSSFLCQKVRPTWVPNDICLHLPVCCSLQFLLFQNQTSLVFLSHAHAGDFRAMLLLAFESMQLPSDASLNSGDLTCLASSARHVSHWDQICKMSHASVMHTATSSHVNLDSESVRCYLICDFVICWCSKVHSADSKLLFAATCHMHH